MSSFEVTSGYGAQKREPMVNIKLQTATATAEATVSPAAALSISIQLRGAALSALADSAVIEMLGGESLTTEECAAILTRFRKAFQLVTEKHGDGS